MHLVRSLDGLRVRILCAATSVFVADYRLGASHADAWVKTDELTRHLQFKITRFNINHIRDRALVCRLATRILTDSQRFTPRADYP
jgi:hypothetical protein